MGIGAGLYMCDVVKKKFTFAILSPDEFLFTSVVPKLPTIPQLVKYWNELEPENLDSGSDRK